MAKDRFEYRDKKDFKHKDVEFHTDTGLAVPSFKKALEDAFHEALRTGSTTNLDVVIWSRGGAKAWAGDYGVEQYDEDPEASVFQRFCIKVEDLGRVP